MSDVSALALRLTHQAGLPASSHIEPLSGGRNNRVYRVTHGGGDAVLKLYHHHPDDPRDRLAAEWAFLGHIAPLVPDLVPRPLAALPGEHAALYSRLAGTRPTAASPDLVAQACAFLAAVNPPDRTVGHLPSASEACFSLAGHIARVEARVARLRGAAAHTEAKTFVAMRLAPVWGRVRTHALARAARAGLAPERPVSRRIASPSDFGLHNTLVDAAGRLRFLDFEYAGQDDPAKLACDTLCQPDTPIGVEHLPAIAEALRLDAEERTRAALLLPVIRVKWAAILLNAALPVGADRRAFADSGEDMARQIALADAMLDAALPEPETARGLP